MLEDKNEQRTALSDLGEFGLIKHLTGAVKLTHTSTVKGVGDDAAVLDFKDKQVLVTTDLLIEGVHFDLSYMPLNASLHFLASYDQLRLNLDCLLLWDNLLHQ